MADTLPREILDRISKVTNKRARVVLDAIVQRGVITTEELKKAGYEHPPRAARDVRELGFSLITTRVKGSKGKPIAAYSLDLAAVSGKAKSGRVQLPKNAKAAILAAAGNKCEICGATHDLQVDHRVPYEIAGESLRNEPDAYLVLDGSCNRRKSWTCEHCENFTRFKRIASCRRCYWASPEKYSHVALKHIRRLDVVWQDDETKAFDAFAKRCRRERKNPATKIKQLICSLE